MTATEAQVAAAMEALGSHKASRESSIGARYCSGCHEWFRDFPAHVSHAVADAVVAAGPDPAKVAADALTLTEERCCEGVEAEQAETGKYSVYTCADIGRSCRTRRVTPWSKP